MKGLLEPSRNARCFSSSVGRRLVPRKVALRLYVLDAAKTGGTIPFTSRPANFAAAETSAVGCIAIGSLTPALAPDFVTVPPTTSSFAADSIE